MFEPISGLTIDPISESKISAEKLHNKKIFVATPMYGGQCAGIYTRNCIQLNKICTKNEIPVEFYFIFNESLISRARNYCVDAFLKGDFTHLMFIDADIEYSAYDVLALACLEKDIICGPCPKKIINWNNIYRAVKEGIVDSHANSNPYMLKNFEAKFVLQFLKKMDKIPFKEPIQLKRSGTGFMMISRETFELYMKKYPEFEYSVKNSSDSHMYNGDRSFAFFHPSIDKESEIYLSEDYAFCAHARKIGLKIWVCPWMQLKHIGTYIYSGNLIDTIHFLQTY